MFAGDSQLFDQASAALDAMGKAKFFLGEVGAGANMKLVINLLLGGSMAVFSEALALAEIAGLQAADVIDVVGLGAVACPMYALKVCCWIRWHFASLCSSTWCLCLQGYVLLEQILYPKEQLWFLLYSYEKKQKIGF